MIMVRNADDDFIALLTADAMERAGATVISITYMGERTYGGALAPHPYFSVWARVRSEAHIASVDTMIDATLEAER